MRGRCFVLRELVCSWRGTFVTQCPRASRVGEIVVSEALSKPLADLAVACRALIARPSSHDVSRPCRRAATVGQAYAGGSNCQWPVLAEQGNELGLTALNGQRRS